MVGAQRQQLQQQNPAGASTVLRRLTLGRHLELVVGLTEVPSSVPRTFGARLAIFLCPCPHPLESGAAKGPSSKAQGAEGNRPCAARARISSSSSSSRIPEFTPAVTAIEYVIRVFWMRASSSAVSSFPMINRGALSVCCSRACVHPDHRPVGGVLGIGDGWARCRRNGADGKSPGH